LQTLFFKSYHNDKIVFKIFKQLKTTDAFLVGFVVGIIIKAKTYINGQWLKDIFKYN